MGEKVRLFREESGLNLHMSIILGGISGVQTLPLPTMPGPFSGFAIFLPQTFQLLNHMPYAFILPCWFQRESITTGHTVDRENPAPPKKPWNVDSP